MRILLDTHILEWLARAEANLKRHEREVLADPANTLLASAISIWEMRIKWQARNAAGQRKGLIDPELAMAFCVENQIKIAPLTAEDCVTVLSPPTPHKDPFDDIMLVHAQRLEAKLLTRDSKLLGHPLVVQL